VVRPQRGGDLRRRPGGREPKRRFLIYCEGAVTEKLYFQGQQQDLRNAGVVIRIGSDHREPLGLVKAAMTHRDRLIGTDPAEQFDQIWCVFDVEAPKKHPGLKEALTLAQREGINCAVSNPCFELWLLLHFTDQTAYLESRHACTQLGKSACDYTPKDKSIDYQQLAPHYSDARQRAQKLSPEHDPAKLRDVNPSTAVWYLVDQLRAGS
jgi:hypothetical protein